MLKVGLVIDIKAAVPLMVPPPTFWKAQTPVLEVMLPVPLTWRLPVTAISSAAVQLISPPAFTVMSPSVLVPVVLLTVNVPEILVAPVTDIVLEVFKMPVAAMLIVPGIVKVLLLAMVTPADTVRVPFTVTALLWLLVLLPDMVK